MRKLSIALCLLGFIFSGTSLQASECREFRKTADGGDIQLFPVSNGRKMGFEAHIANENKPTLILLPGVYRAALSSDLTLKELSRRNINWLSIHLSTQPMPIDRGNTVDATFKDVTTVVLKDEALKLVQELCIKNPIYVTLSFSGSLGTELKKTDTNLVIDTTPLGTFTDGLPDGGLSYNLIDFWYSFNPLLKPEWTAMKEANYRRFWKDAIDEYIVRYPALAENPKLKEVAVSGYTSMSQAIEYYDLRKTNYKNSPQRIFILAEKEDDGRRQTQLLALDRAKIEFGMQPLTIIIMGSNHNVLSEAPIAWAKALEISLSSTPTPTRVALVEKDGSTTWLTPAQWAIVRARLFQPIFQAHEVP